MTESPISKQGKFYHSADKGRIYNLGQKEIKAMTESGAPIDITFQVADIQTPLGSVRRLCQAGHRVVFEGENDGSYIEHIESGVVYLYIWKRDNT